MIVVFAEKLPPAVRGKLKLWFVEPVPNVFISSVSDALAGIVADRLFESCPKESGMLIVRSKRGAPGYVLMQKAGREAGRRLTSMTRLQLVGTISAQAADGKSQEE